MPAASCGQESRGPLPDREVDSTPELRGPDRLRTRADAPPVETGFAIRDLCRGWRLRGLDPLIEEALGEQ